MKILAFSDLHSSKSRLKDLLKKIISSNPDILISAGDTSNFGSNLKEIISEIKKTKKILLIIPGNHETCEEIRKISDGITVIDLHKRIYKIEDVIFIGYGTGGFSKKEPEFEEISKRFGRAIENTSKIILITHGPPYGTKTDLIHDLGHMGCISYTNFIKKHKPMLHICGHLHETWHIEDILGNTRIINPGPDGKILKI
ncbi:metallophosphoesterase [Candidatus Woesearchaeota archaeon]|nr:metallophosphoesterase [Candidatus Woesearchaeota archaeon]